MGVLFPLVTVIWTQQFASAGRGVGTAYAINTTGTIFGALLGGLFILPWLGIQHSLVLSAGIYLLVAIIFWHTGTSRFSVLARAGFPLGSLLIFLLIAWLVPPWDRVVWGNGVYYRPDYTLQKMADKSLHDVMAQNELLYYKEGLDGTVVVTRDERQKYLLINGKFDASSFVDLQTQLLLGHLPALLHRNPNNALIIGLGSGITAGAVAAHANIEEITVLEIVPEVVEASAFFAVENQQVLQDPRVEVVTADARNYVLSTDQTWDIIISEPSNPWISGISNLFTDDFFKLIKQRLAPGGILTQWFHSYSMSVADVKSVMRTFAQSFDYVSIWNLQIGDLVLIGSDSPYELDLDRFASALADEKIGYDLERAKVTNARDLLQMHLLSGEQLRSYIAGADLNTDDRPRIEYNAPRNLYAETTYENLVSVARHIDNRPAPLPVTGLLKYREAGLTVPAMKLDIEFANPDNITAVDAQWLIRRELLVVDGKEYVGIGSNRQVQWQDKETMRSLQAIWFAEMPAPDALDILLNSELKLPVAQNGDIVMHGGHDGRWLLSAQDGQIELGIAWSCPDTPAGVTRFFAYSRLSDPGEAAWEHELVKLAGHFKCRISPNGDETRGSE